MKFLKIPFLLIWRLWFYILMFITIILMAPILLIFTFKETYYHLLWKLVRIWSKVLIYGMGFRLCLQLDQEIEPNKSYIFCPNHSSLMDPFVLILLSKNPIVFVGKQELAKIPIFGYFYKKVVIMVDRSSPKSRKRVYKKAKKRLQNGVSMAIFPEGLVPTEEVVLAPFKKGAFSLAIEFNIPIVPQVYFDCKRLFSWDFLKGSPGVFRIHQHSFIETEELIMDDLNSLKQQTFDIIHNDLSTDLKYMNDTNQKEMSVKLNHKYSDSEEQLNIWSHALGLLASIIAFPFLLKKAFSYSDFWEIASFIIYACSLIILYAASTFYHAAKKPKKRRMLNIFDHAAIYVLIAGSYSPFCLVALKSYLGWYMFLAVWVFALIGIVLKLFFTGRFDKISTAMYLLMGWQVLFFIKPLIAAITSFGLNLLIAGGIFYTVGAILYSIKKMPYNHATFHVFVLLGSVSHFLALYFL